MNRRDDDKEVKLPLTEEHLAVGRQRKRTGATRVELVTLEQSTAVDVPVAQEEVVVERVPIMRVVEAASPPRQEGDEWIIPVYEERIVATKQLFLKEEVRVRKLHSESVVRHEELVRKQEPRITRTAARGPAGEKP
jgi:uncharacterized protein (TIGR02271 family)